MERMNKLLLARYKYDCLYKLIVVYKLIIQKLYESIFVKKKNKK